MGMEFGFGGGDEFGTIATDIGANAFTPPAPSGGFSFGDVANTISSGAKAFGSGVKDVLSPFADVAKGISPLVGVAAPVAGIVAQQQAGSQMARQNKLAERGMRTAESSASAAQGAAAPLTKFGADSLARAQRGEIPPAMQAQIEEWKRGAKAQMHQYLASIGQGNSQALQEVDSQIEQQGVAMAAQMLEQEISQGTGALTGAAGALTGAGGVAGNVARTEASGVGDLERLIAQANEAMSRTMGAG